MDRGYQIQRKQSLVEIVWYGQCSFRLRGNDVTLITDPFVTVTAASPQIVTVSNPTLEINEEQLVAKNIQLVSGPGEYAISKVNITGIMTSLTEAESREQRNTAYLIQMDGTSLCHLGHMKTPLTDRQVDQLTPVDVLFVPIGTEDVISLSNLSRAIQAMNPRLIIPMSYSEPDGSGNPPGLNDFLQETGSKAEEPQQRIQVTPNNLPLEPKILTFLARPIN